MRRLRGELSEQLHVGQQRLLFAQGAAHGALNRSRHITGLQDAEFQVFSQWGEDGIIQHLIHAIPIVNRTFIEFGVESFKEANCRFLMMHDNWSGFVLDGSSENVAAINARPDAWRYDLRAVSKFVTRENIAASLDESGFDRDLGILSIDIDGVDYWIAQELMAWRPRILIMEYNAVFGVDRAIVVPYRDDFNRTRAHPSNLYYGASLPALQHLAALWGYALVGTTSSGVNAFFVRTDLLNDLLHAVSLEDAFTMSRFRESRDDTGRLTLMRGNARLDLLRGLPVVNVVSGASEAI